MRIAICEDDKLQDKINKDYIVKWASKKDVSVEIESFDSGEKFLFRWPEEATFDIVLLEINMKGISGIELAKKIREIDKYIIIIFITGAKEYALEGYEVNALNYLLKPLEEKKIFKCLDIALEQIEEKMKNDDYLVLPKGKENIKIDLNKVYYISAFDHYIDIHYKDEVVTFKNKIGEVEKLLNKKEEYIRNHRSYIVNLKKVVKMSNKTIFLSNGSELPISKQRLADVNEKFTKIFK